MDKGSLGREGERLAAVYLRKLGYKIVETNYKCSYGEVDIIALDKDSLVFIEVKTRSSRDYGLPQEAVGKRKLTHIINVASYYRMIKNNLPSSERIDVLAIEVGKEGKMSFELLQNVTG